MYRSSPFANLTPVVKNILIINVLVFLAQNVLGRMLNITDLFALHYPASDSFISYQAVTYMFLHADFGHIFFNMFAVFMFGAMLERVWGPKRFLTFYMVTGIGAALIQFLVVFFSLKYYEASLSFEEISAVYSEGKEALMKSMNFTNPIMAKMNLALNTGTIGASGAVFGILMGFGMLFPNAQLMLLFPPIPIKGKYIAILALVMGIFLDFRGNVAHFAHLGGMLFGYFMIRYWRNKGIY